MNIFRSHIISFLRLMFPRICPGCESDLYDGELHICLQCRQDLVETSQRHFRENSFYRLFRPHLPVEMAAALYFYGNGLIIQRLLHDIKYRGNIALAVHLGASLGAYLTGPGIFPEIDLLVPVPLHPGKKSVRGFNQSELICRGMADQTGWKVHANAIVRSKSTKTQTNRTRQERWENVSNAFELRNPDELAGRRVMLVDDVVTTGATLLACAMVLKEVPDIRISVSALAIADEL